MSVLEIVAALPLLLLGFLILDVFREEFPQWYQTRPWDPPAPGVSSPDQDVEAIFNLVLRAYRCRVASVGRAEDSEILAYCRKVLGDAYSETSQNMFSPVDFKDENHAEVYFERVRGPRNGRGGILAVSRRKSGRWGIDGWVGGQWVS